MKMREKGAVLVTGAAGGLGKACALRLVREGYKVFAGVRDLRAAEGLSKEIGPRLTTILLDITIAEQVKAAAELVGDSLGQEAGLVGLINTAGIALSGPLEFLPLESLRRIFEVNVIGQVSVIQAFLPLLRRSQGRIVNLGSGSGIMALPFVGGYSASKFALRALNDSLRRELRPWRIAVILVDLGFIGTGLKEKSLAEAKETLEGLPPDAKDLYARPFSAGIKFMTRAFEEATPAESVAELIFKALREKRPKSRYGIGAHIRKASLAKFMPAGWTDRLVWRLLGRYL